LKFDLILLCGGVGARLWPKSRASMSKPFLQLPSNDSLFKHTLDRLDIHGMENVVIIANKEYEDLVKSSVSELEKKYKVFYIFEFLAKNTSPAIALGINLLSKLKSNNPVLISPSDHYISEIDKFKFSISDALNSLDDYIYCFGVKPTYPETGYGYIEDLKNTCKFFEKPNYDTARSFIEKENFYWNSGLFLGKLNIISKAFLDKDPNNFNIANDAIVNYENNNIFYISEDITNRFIECSFDNAIMENIVNVGLFKVSYTWSDIGSWLSYEKLLPEIDNGNRIEGDNIKIFDSEKTTIISESKLVVATGLKNIIIVNSSDALLIFDKSKSQDIKKIYEILKRDNHDAVFEHEFVKRPWGNYEILTKGQKFRVKKIVINPLSSISLQKHFFRSEHWVIVNGTASIEKNSKFFELESDQSIYIKRGDIHRISNNDPLKPLEFIEVQTGENISESDILRIKDNYGRC
jgi:mannose-1-phosphate guanylyltransferase